MKKILFIALALVIAQHAVAQTFTLSSADLGGQFTPAFVAGNMGCNGQNHSPELHWSHAPVNAQSFAVKMYDPDAPTGSGFWHWVIVDIPANISRLKQGAGDLKSNLAPAGSLQSANDTGARGYQGPCPPEGDAPHRYIITVYALNTAKLGTKSTSTAAITGFMLNKAAIAKASLIVYSKR
ncbi:YbhB/YbcL family Raf kinase inhibitor-like protein [Mucilaginibacter sp. 14171R-50]|uniref:YbhB/YbcL family Raf kinase inhibitor-like protein n=1 Tax=Mucilaginibacter sp. 14171R-50 TaxID=2703789 RepID=UPI00138BC05D|nr:YbhB/YbcL family Raf kinase inhibitor-like protein [Mucilaginibacter sp. 14171R-50]QHS56414.1 YbhB/YbcL family Raf kinase inhibitor-like protein [Mucilaginibacter sp. 14171R-50]